MAKSNKNAEQSVQAAEPVDDGIVDASYGAQEGEGRSEVLANAAGKRRRKGRKGPRTAYYLITAKDRNTGELVIIGHAPTKGRVVKLWQGIYQMAVRQYHAFDVLRCRPVDELSLAMFSHFKG